VNDGSHNLFQNVFCRYCAKLPSDAFTHLTPKCALSNSQINGSTMYQAKLRLPINSPIKLQVTELDLHLSVHSETIKTKLCDLTSDS
jgi:hypothetical protein